jgi:tyrosine-protein kinase Etk/Wzc
MSTVIVERRAANRLPPEPLPGDAFGLRSAVQAIRERGVLVAAVFTSVLALAALMAWITPPVYRADTLIRIDLQGRDSLVPAMPGGDRPAAEPPRGTVAGEQNLITSRALLVPAIAAAGADIELGRARSAWGLPARGRHGVEVSVLQLPAAWRGQPLQLQVGQGQWTLQAADGRPLAAGTAGRPAAFQVDGQAAAIQVQAPADGPALRFGLRLQDPLQSHEQVLKRVRVLELARDSGVVRLTYEDRSARRSALLLNTLVNAYIGETVRRRADEGERALAFVEAQLPPMKQRLESAEEELARHLQQTRVLTPSAESEALLRQRGDLERQLVDLQVRRDQLAQNLTPEHPELATVLRQIGTVQAAIGRLGSSTSRLPAQSQELARLQRVVQSETQLYTAMLQHAQQLRLASGSWLPGAVQLDRAVVPVEHVRPRWATSLTLGTAAGLVLALGTALLARALQGQASHALGTPAADAPPTLAMVPESSTQRRLMAGAMDRSELDAESLHELGTHRLLARAAPDDPAVQGLCALLLALAARERTAPTQVLMLTSPATGAGKTFVAANLAALMAETGRKVLLIDADARHPGLHQLVGLDPRSEGLSDLLSRRSVAYQAIHRHASAGFDVLLHGTRGRGAALLSPALEPLLQSLRERYDHIVINASPALHGQEAVFLGRLADLTCLVLRADRSGAQESRQALQLLQQAGVKVEGLVLNGVRRGPFNSLPSA